MSIHCMMELNVIEEIYMFVDVLFSDPFRISDELGVDVSIVLCDGHIGDTHSYIALMFFVPRVFLLNTLCEPQFVVFTTSPSRCAKITVTILRRGYASKILQCRSAPGFVTLISAVRVLYYAFQGDRYSPLPTTDT